MHSRSRGSMETTSSWAVDRAVWRADEGGYRSIDERTKEYTVEERYPGDCTSRSRRGRTTITNGTAEIGAHRLSDYWPWRSLSSVPWCSGGPYSMTMMTALQSLTWALRSARSWTILRNSMASGLSSVVKSMKWSRRTRSRSVAMSSSVWLNPCSSWARLTFPRLARGSTVTRCWRTIPSRLTAGCVSSSLPRLRTMMTNSISITSRSQIMILGSCGRGRSTISLAAD